MTKPYSIFGVEMSPYSVKVRSYFRYKAIPHRWIVRNTDAEADYQRFAKLQTGTGFGGHPAIGLHVDEILGRPLSNEVKATEAGAKKEEGK